MQQSISSIAKKVSQQGQSAANIDGITAQADKISAQIAKLTDTSNGVDMQHIMSVYSEMMMSQMQFGSSMLNASRGVEMMSLYFDFASDMMRINRAFFSKVSSVCLPGSRAF